MRKLILTMCACSLIVLGCTENQKVKTWGGEGNLTLPINQELVNITWKQDNMWVLVKDYTLKKYVFREYSNYGVLEGSYIINDSNFKDKPTITISDTISIPNFSKLDTIAYEPVEPRYIEVPAELMQVQAEIRKELIKEKILK